MKVQVRHGVFETNSSSMHALALQKDFTDNCEICKEKYKDLIPEHILLELISEDSYEDEKIVGKKYIKLKGSELVASKLNFVYSQIVKRIYACSQYNSTTYSYQDILIFFNRLNKLGIKYTIKFCGWEDNLDDIWYVYSDFPDELFDRIWTHKEEDFCNFLFGDGSKIDGYETDCIPYDSYEKYEDEFWEELENKGKCETFSYYGG